LIIYTDFEKHQLPLIEHLWNENCKLHNKTSLYFEKEFDPSIFRKRLTAWDIIDIFRFTVAQVNSEIIGYCISSVQREKGLIESLYINPTYRRQGVGRTLIESHISWFKRYKCSEIEVTTVFGNEDAIEFYKSIGILPKTITMRLSDKCTNDN